jgi:hypothetical protein
MRSPGRQPDDGPGSSSKTAASFCEEWGGNTIFVDVSALKGQGVDKLLEMLVLQAEYLELKANPNRPPKAAWSSPASNRAVPPPPCWCAKAPCASATPS